MHDIFRGLTLISTMGTGKVSLVKKRKRGKYPVVQLTYSDGQVEQVYHNTAGPILLALVAGRFD